MRQAFLTLCSDNGQDTAEYDVMVAVLLRLIGSNSNTVFPSVASAIG
jgi:hypothetical protein